MIGLRVGFVKSRVVPSAFRVELSPCDVPVKDVIENKLLVAKKKCNVFHGTVWASLWIGYKVLDAVQELEEEATKELGTYHHSDSLDHERLLVFPRGMSLHAIAASAKEVGAVGFANHITTLLKEKKAFSEARKAASKAGHQVSSWKDFSAIPSEVLHGCEFDGKYLFEVLRKVGHPVREESLEKVGLKNGSLVVAVPSSGARWWKEHKDMIVITLGCRLRGNNRAIGQLSYVTRYDDRGATLYPIVRNSRSYAYERLEATPEEYRAMSQIVGSPSLVIQADWAKMDEIDKNVGIFIDYHAHENLENLRSSLRARNTMIDCCSPRVVSRFRYYFGNSHITASELASVLKANGRPHSGDKAKIMEMVVSLAVDLYKQIEKKLEEKNLGVYVVSATRDANEKCLDTKEALEDIPGIEEHPILELLLTAMFLVRHTRDDFIFDPRVRNETYSPEVAARIVLTNPREYARKTLFLVGE